MAETILPEDLTAAKKEAKRAKAREYARLRRKENPEAFKLATEKWRAKNREKMLCTMKAWRVKNAARRKEYATEHYASNKDRLIEEARKFRKNNPAAVRKATTAWREKNRERHMAAQRIRVKRFFEAHPEAQRAYTEARRTRKAQAIGSHSSEDIQRILAAQKHKCAYCKASLKKMRYHIDHITPLSKGGTNHPRNLQAACPTCNRKKSAKDPISFAQEIGRLL